MVELQTCASLVNASALCPMEREVKGDGVNVIAEITAELERERQKNAQLLERISILEAQLQQRNKESLPTNGQGNSPTAIERSLRKPKRQKIEIASDGIENGHINKGETASQKMNDPQYLAQKETNLGDHLINWMSMDETQFLHFEKFKDGDSTADYDDTDDSDDEDDDYREDDDINRDYKVGITDDNSRIANELKEFLNEGVDEVTNIPCVENSSGGQNATTYTIINQETNEYQKENHVEADKQAVHDERELNILDQTLAKKTGAPSEILHTGPGSLSSQKKPPKMAFCPKEVKRIIESDILLQKNAQSHTIRKIIVFASLGIRHGCEDMYELDFNHFSILRKGESYVSPKNPGEHVLYENPGVRKKVFYPNRQNPTLCPVQILEEEKAMRPSDASCPSCLFLCIKYGGRTRNLPQNEYVRQRMGRNKLKSFGPLMCRIAKLVHIRSGSFFFKALGITLLFMAGFPDDLVQRETKYRNLDLLQKYYRTDEDAEGEELFHQHAPPDENQANAGSKHLSGKSVSTKARGRKKTRLNTKYNNLQIPTVLQSRTSSSAPSAQFGLIGCTPIHTQSMAALQSIPPQNPADAMAISNQMIPRTATNVSYPAPYQVFPQQQANAFLPIMYWPPPNTFAPGRYPSTYSLQSFPSTANYMSVHQQPYYSHNSSSLFTPNKVGGTEKNNVATEEADSDSDNSSSSTDPEEH